MVVSTTATLLDLAKFSSMDTLEMCGDIWQPGGQLETPGLVLEKIGVCFLHLFNPSTVEASNWDPMACHFFS